MKIAVMGAGGVGGYFGGRLAADGNDVTFIARGAHLDAMRTSGLRIRSPAGDATVYPANATSDPAQIGPVDVVLFATKLYDVKSAGGACKALIGPETAVISLLNGIDSEDTLAEILGAAHVAGGVAYIGACIAAPGVIEHTTKTAALHCGELDGRSSPRLERFVELARAAGIDARLSSDIRHDIWSKFVFLSSFSAVTALTRLPIGPIRDVPEAWSLMGSALDEAIAVARANGIDLAAGEKGRALRLIENLPPGTKASMVVDLERGNRLELDWLSGAVCRLGRQLGVDTAVHRVAGAALKPYVNGTPDLP